jgi:Ca-activated chloride channel homolog
VIPLLPVAPFAQNRARLGELVGELVADGDTALYDAVEQSWDRIEALGDDTRINAVVVLSDGEDTASARKLDAVLGKLRERSRGEGRQIRVLTIAYGSAANEDVLEDIARASGGNAYEGDPDDIAAVYLQISSFF